MSELVQAHYTYHPKSYHWKTLTINNWAIPDAFGRPLISSVRWINVLNRYFPRINSVTELPVFHNKTLEIYFREFKLGHVRPFGHTMKRWSVKITLCLPIKTVGDQNQTMGWGWNFLKSCALFSCPGSSIPDLGQSVIQGVTQWLPL